MMWNIGEGWGWWMVFGWVWMVGFWALIIWAVYSLVARWSDRSRAGSERERTPTEILEQRYAQGELTSEQFETMRRQLQQARESRAA